MIRIHLPLSPKQLQAVWKEQDHLVNKDRYFSGQNFQTKDPLTLTEHSLGGSWFHPRKVFPSAWHWYERSNWQAGRKWLALLCLGQQTGAVFHIELKLLGAASNADNRASWCLSQCKQVFKRSRLFTPAWKHEGWGGINFQLRFMWDLNKPSSNIFLKCLFRCSTKLTGIKMDWLILESSRLMWTRIRRSISRMTTTYAYIIIIHSLNIFLHHLDFLFWLCKIQ